MAEELDLYKRKLAREISARQQAETLIEQKSLELYQEARRRELAVVALRESEERYRLLVELSPDAILIESGGEIVFANPAAQLLFRAQQPADLLGRAMLALVAPAFWPSVKAALGELQHGGFCPLAEEQAVRLDGSIVDVAVTRIAFQYREQPAIQIVLRDISERKRLETQILYQATHDPLTGLPNRSLLHDRLSHAIAYAARYNHPVWVVLLDVDRFKAVNDLLGHKAGDMVLNAIAERLQAAMRETDTVARLGGDEFVLVLPGPGDGDLSNSTMQRIVEAVARPLTVEGKEFFLTCSMGVALYPNDGTDPEMLVEHADIAMYRAKEIGRNNYQFFTATLNQRLQERLRLESDLRNALERREFLLHYQPQVDLRSGRVTGMEALIRWQHPELGMVPPGSFISLAEDTGLIVPIGAWVIRTACAQNKAWQNAGMDKLRIAVNLSARQFSQHDLVQSIAAVLEETGMPPSLLEIELTESLVMTDVERATEILRDLKAIGVQLSIDDFGTGYSSLSYLKRFPIDVLKIDQSFVRDITVDPDDAAIVMSIISLAHSLRLHVIAEGVETEAQLAYLRRHDCDLMQGHYFSRPVSHEEFLLLHQQGRRLPAADGDGAEPGRTLLILDDEAKALAALFRLLRRDDYHVLTAQTPAEAFELLARHRVQVILCDQLMPQMTGTEFLSRIKEMYPETVRIVLSGHTEYQSVIEAVNRGAIYRYFTKPWEDDLLRAHVRDAFAHYHLQSPRSVA